MKIPYLLLVMLVALPFSVFAQTQPSPSQGEKDIELNTVLMESTFMIQGQNAQGASSIGAAFVIGRPIPNQTNRAAYVLVTAAHVLEEMRGEIATLHLRKKSDSGNWVRLPFPVQIRTNGQPRWTKHPDADVAVMYVNLPTETSIPLLSSELLADDKTLSEFEIHPGDELECLGYPLGFQANDAGFPILRSGKIASYPLLPTKATKTFLLDFRVFKGNSGGPVYFVQSNRYYQGGFRLGQTIHIILGLVSQESLFQQQISGPYSEEVRQVQLGLAVVVHAGLIKDAINMLPPPQPPPTN